MRLTVLVKDGKKELFLKTPLVIEEPSEILLKSATVYWNYNNVDNDDENFIVIDKERVEFEHGYWSFDNIKDKLEKKGIHIAKERTTGKCTIRLNGLTYFKTLGVLLGLKDFSNLKAGTTSTSPGMVNINRGFRSLDLSCNVVDKSKNIDKNGNYSDVIANIPIPTDKSLKGTLSHYNDINNKVSINRGTYNFLEFNVRSNVVGDDRIVGDTLLELYITPRIK